MITLNTNLGDIVIELDEANAPVSSANFKQYVEDGFYDGTIFHRVIKGFMVQGGGFLPDMMQKATRDNIENEAKNGLKNVRGSLAMARTSAPHSASSQFFINVKDNSFLDYPSQDGWGYCVFAKVTEGLDILEQIENVAIGNKAGHGDVPLEPVVINAASISD
jgi:peptidyl-prolyl cis-trans isomerase B (cyclophilin B)